MSGTVVVVGSLNADLTLAVRTIPRPGETVLATADPSQGCGGKGANQAVATARAGAGVRMVGCVGVDAAGDLLVERLQAEGIDVGGVRRGPWPTGLAVVTVDEAGENAIIVASGANRQCDAELVVAGLRDVGEGDVVVAQAEIPLDAIDAAGHRAASSGARFVLNLAPSTAVDPALLDVVDVLVVNEHEAADLLQHLGSAGGADEPVAARLGKRVRGAVVVTLGGAGVLLADGDGCASVPAFPVERIVDTTGAGDAFVGALCAALARGESLAAAVRWGSAAGSIAVGVTGAQGGRATPSAIGELLAQRDG